MKRRWCRLWILGCLLMVLTGALTACDRGAPGETAAASPEEVPTEEVREDGTISFEERLAGLFGSGCCVRQDDTNWTVQYRDGAGEEREMTLSSTGPLLGQIGEAVASFYADAFAADMKTLLENSGFENVTVTANLCPVDLSDEQFVLASGKAKQVEEIENSLGEEGCLLKLNEVKKENIFFFFPLYLQMEVTTGSGSGPIQADWLTVSGVPAADYAAAFLRGSTGNTCHAVLTVTEENASVTRYLVGGREAEGDFEQAVLRECPLLSGEGILTKEEVNAGLYQDGVTLVDVQYSGTGMRCVFCVDGRAVETVFPAEKGACRIPAVYRTEKGFAFYTNKTIKYDEEQLGYRYEGENLLISCDADGNILWRREIAGDEDSIYVQMACDGAGNLYFSYQNESNQQQFFLFDAGGNLLWEESGDFFYDGIYPCTEGAYLLGRDQDMNRQTAFCRPETGIQILPGLQTPYQTGTAMMSANDRLYVLSYAYAYETPRPSRIDVYDQEGTHLAGTECGDATRVQKLDGSEDIYVSGPDSVIVYSGGLEERGRALLPEGERLVRLLRRGDGYTLYSSRTSRFHYDSVEGNEAMVKTDYTAGFETVARFATDNCPEDLPILSAGTDFVRACCPVSPEELESSGYVPEGMEQYNAVLRWSVRSTDTVGDVVYKNYRQEIVREGETCWYVNGHYPFGQMMYDVDSDGELEYLFITSEGSGNVYCVLAYYDFAANRNYTLCEREFHADDDSFMLMEEADGTVALYLARSLYGTEDSYGFATFCTGNRVGSVRDFYEAPLRGTGLLS